MASVLSIFLMELHLLIQHGSLRTPAMSAVLTSTDIRILNVIDSNAGRGSLVLLPPANMYQNSWDKQENPEEKVDNPPPRANKDPPETAMPLFLVLGFSRGD